jgi:DNA uptake protein ComE-like DNA-binding protein
MVDLNVATLDELAALPGVGEALAYDLLLWRPYLSWEEVSNVPGFDRARVELLRKGGARVGLPNEPRWSPSRATGDWL